MKTVKRLFFIVLTALCLSSCHIGHRVKPAIISDYVSFSVEEDSSSEVLDGPALEALNEVNAFLNTNRIDFTAYLIAIEPNLEIPVYSCYSDDDVIVQTNLQNEGIQEITTRDKSYIEGDGFKVYKTINNEVLFVNEYLDYTKYMNSIRYSNDSSTLEFKIDLSKFSSSSCISYGSMFELSSSYNLDLSNMLFVATFANNKVSALSTAFQAYVDSLGQFVTLVYAFVVNGYGDTFTKKEIELDGYWQVDDESFDIVKNDIERYIEFGNGYTVLPAPFYYDTNTEIIDGDTIVGRIYLSNESEDIIQIKFSDTTFDKNSFQCTYNFLGKDLTFKLNSTNLPFISESETLPFDTINHNSDDAIEFDYDNGYVLLESDEKLVILDIDSLNVVVEFDVEGDIVNIINHDEVYHILTVTEAPIEQKTKKNGDRYCKGKIYIINKGTLLLSDEPINVDTYPYYTAIDKRGDIIISPGYGSHSTLYIYKTTQKVMEPISSTSVYCCCYIEYHEDLDMILGNETMISGRSPYYIYYQDDEYFFDSQKYFGADRKKTGFFRMCLIYKHYYVADTGYMIVDFSDWDDPKTLYCQNTGLNYFSKNTPICFASNDTIYILKDYNDQISALIKNSLVDDGIVTYCQFIFKSFSDYSFGFVRDGKIYLYDNTAKEFFIYIFD